MAQTFDNHRIVGGARAELLITLSSACLSAGLDAANPKLVRLADDGVVYRLPGGAVVRIGAPGEYRAARREIDIARWLANSDIDVVQPIPGIEQPVSARGRAVTFWCALPPYRPAEPAELAAVLVRLHRLRPVADLDLGLLAPFARIERWLPVVRALSPADHDWLRSHLAELRQRWPSLPAGRPWALLHGDARAATAVVTADGRVLLRGLERVAIGPPEWDLALTGMKLMSFGWIGTEQYAGFCREYGQDVLRWPGYYLLRDIRELEMAVTAAMAATSDSGYLAQARFRVRCLRGDEGPRQWPAWRPLRTSRSHEPVTGRESLSE